MMRKSLILLTILLVAVAGCRLADDWNNDARLDAIDRGLAERFRSVGQTGASSNGSVAISDDSLASSVDSLAGDGEVGQAMRQFYEARDFAPAWTDGRALNAHAAALVNDLKQAHEHGIAIDRNEAETLLLAVEETRDDPDPDAWIEADLLLTKAFMRLMRTHLRGQVDPGELAYENYLEAPSVALDSLLRRALDAPAPSSFAAVHAPQHVQYTRLREALAQYRTIAEEGGWPTLTLGDEDLLEPGVRDPQVVVLRKRLAATGDLAGTDTSAVYDDALVAAVARFQARHGLMTDSLVGGSTLSALNVPVEDRIRQIELTLERWRWLPRDLGDRYVFVNIPEFKVHAYESRGKVLSMPVVVGAQYSGRETPTFIDEMDHVVFRPYWNVPVSIATEEILPKTQGDPGYLARNGYEVVAASGEVMAVDTLSAAALRNGAYRVRQKTGPNNALGLVKFMFPNAHHIYLHDTPADHLFKRTERAFSHGCIRLEDPARFAEYVLGPEGWTRDRIDRALAASEQEVVQLKHKFPVYIAYMTAFVEDDGTVAFREDIYGYDAALDEAMPRVNRSSPIAMALADPATIGLFWTPTAPAAPADGGDPSTVPSLLLGAIISSKHIFVTKHEAGIMSSNFLIYLFGYIIISAGVVYALAALGLGTTWIVPAVLILLGVGIVAALSRSKRGDVADAKVEQMNV